MRGGGETQRSSEEKDLFQELYTTLYRKARRTMAQQPPGHTLQPTALVNEVFLRIGRRGKQSWENESHFLVVAARAMRQVLVDHARRKGAAKRGGGASRDPLDGIFVEYFDRSADIEALHVALEQLEEFDPEMARALELRFFAGRSMDQVARILGVPKRSLERRWAATRAWLYAQVR